MKRVIEYSKQKWDLTVWEYFLAKQSYHKTDENPTLFLFKYIRIFKNMFEYTSLTASVSLPISLSI
jgi:hypothetical protein